ncbi:hypothetical protein D3C79_813680 [compost metagenome]
MCARRSWQFCNRANRGGLGGRRPAASSSYRNSSSWARSPMAAISTMRAPPLRVCRSRSRFSTSTLLRGSACQRAKAAAALSTMSELSSRKTSSSSLSPGLSGSSADTSPAAGSNAGRDSPKPSSMSGCSGVTESIPTRPVASGARACANRLRKLSTSAGRDEISCPAATSSSMSSRASWPDCAWAKKRGSAARLPSSTAP